MADRLGWVRSTGPAGLPPMVQRTPLQPRSPETRSYRALILLGRPAWAYRVELAAVGMLVVAWSVLDRALPGVVALVVLAAGVAGPALGHRGAARRAGHHQRSGSPDPRDAPHSRR